MRNNGAFYGQVAFNGLESLAASDYANMGLMFPQYLWEILIQSIYSIYSG